MTPGEFLNEFGAVANAPGGVQRLREMILQLAVQGKLVEQNPDESVENLIKKCHDTKNKYIKELKLQNTKIFSDISKSEYQYIIPVNWKWVPMDHVSNYIQRGKSPKYDDSSEVKIISQKCVRWSGVDLTPARGLDANIFEKYTDERFLIDGDLLWNSTGTGTVGRACIFEQSNKPKIVADSHVTVIRAPEIESRYLWCFLASPMIQARFNPEHPKKLVSGTTNQVELSTGSVKALPIPLPPLEEQKRIVAKVDQLMALCDQLEAQQQKRSNLVKLTRVSALEALANAQRGEELQTAWKRVEENLPTLFEGPEDVEDLKKCILQNAVMGKLVPQNSDDEPASELLKKITKEKAELIKKGEIKRQNPLPEIRDDEKPFEIPAGWEWCRLNDTLIDFIGGFAYKSERFKSNTNYQVLRLGNVKNDHLKLDSNPVYIDENYANDTKAFELKIGDVLITMTGTRAKRDYCFTTVLKEKDFNGLNLYLNQRVGCFRFSKGCEVKYLNLMLKVDLLLNQIFEKATGTANQANVGKGSIVETVFPLPPIAEQKRIVEKAKSLLSLCDTLQKQLAKSRKVAEQLAQSVVESITGISTEKQETMKAPKTELVTRLKLVKKPGIKDHAPLSAILVKNNDELSAKALWNNSGLPIDEFYRQLKFEMVNGWIEEPEKAEVLIVEDQK